MSNEQGDILPSSALSCIATPRGMIQGPGGMWIPLYCANCGADCGYAPEWDREMWFFLCNYCVRVWGAVAAEMMMPFEVFIEKVQREQIESYGHLLNAAELAKVLEAGDSPLAKLINSGRKGNT